MVGKVAAPNWSGSRSSRASRGGAVPTLRRPGGDRRAAARAAEPQPVVLGVRRAVRLGLAVFVYVPIVWSVYLSFFDARNTVTPTDFVGLRNYRDMLRTRRSRQPAAPSSCSRVFIVPATFALSLGARPAGQPGSLRQGLLPVGVLPADRVLLRGGVADLEAVDLQRRAVRAGQHRAAARSASTRSPGCR